MRRLEFLIEDGSRNAQQMTAMFEVGRGWDFFNQPVTFDGQRRGGREKLWAFEMAGYFLESRNLVAGQQRQQMLQTQGKRPENHFGAFGSADLSRRASLPDEDVSGNQPLGG